MLRKSFHGSAVALLALWVASCSTLPSGEGPSVESLLRGDDAAAISDWVVLGAFPSPAADADDNGVTRAGFDQDFLEELGGEAEARLAEGQEVAGKVATAVSATADGRVDLRVPFDADYAVAYAYTELHARAPREVTCFFASDDWAKVWLNGELVHRVWDGDGRGITPREDRFVLPLQRGTNRILVKVDQNTGPWGFMFELAPPRMVAAIEAEQARKAQYARALESRLAPMYDWDWTFAPGPFPEVQWEGLDAVRAIHGEVTPAFRWFDGGCNEVTQADAPGRYAVYAEIDTPGGITLRRAATFYCRPAEFEPWWAEIEVELPYFESPMVDEAVWKERQEDINEFAGMTMVDSLFWKASGAVFLAGMGEAEVLGRPTTQLDRPAMKNQDYHLALKRKILGVPDRPCPLAPPRPNTTGAVDTVLAPAKPRQAGVDPASLDAVRAACQAWYDATGIPFSVLLARGGKVYFHEPFGDVPVDVKFGLASLTKGHCGLMLTQFIDQGLIGLDDPVGKYLPDFATEGDKVITLRDCVTHTTGFDGHGNWGGMDNPWFDNHLAMNLEILEPHTAYLYNGLGFDLAGKVMEMVSGKSIFRLMHENFFMPLGQDNPTIEDLGYGITCTVEDLARVGQLILNKGSYAGKTYYDATTWDTVVDPQPLSNFYPKLGTAGATRYNLGWHYVEERRTDVEVKEGEQAPLIFSPNSIMHGAATGAVLRVDFDNELVVAICRPTPGPDYGKHLPPVLMSAVDGLK